MSGKPSPRTEREIIDAFRAAMASAGLRTSDKMVADGELQRFHVEGDPPKTKNGWYVLFTDNLPAGEFGCWKRGVKATWCDKPDHQLTPEESRQVRERIEAARREREERERIKHEAAAAEARAMWDAAAEVEGDAHPYLQRKGVPAHGLRIGVWPTGAPALLVPIMDAPGRIVSLQAIFANVNPVIGRDKDFLAGGKKRGCFFSIGQPPSGAAIINLAEGYATGATAYAANGHFTLVAFDAWNLKHVAHVARRFWPAATILLCADNDQWTMQPVENPGVTVARQVQEAIPARVHVAVPKFASLDGKPTDFNDLHQREGIDAVRQQLLAALPTPEPANDNAPQVLPLTASVSPFGFPHLSDKGQPLNTVENLAYLLEQYGITCQYNQVRKQVEVDIPGRAYSIDNRANCSLAELTSLCARNRMPQSMLSDYVKLLADHNAYNPVRDWIESKPWDGVERLADLYATVRADMDDEQKKTLMYRWLLSAVAAVYHPHGFSSHGVLVFTGEQGEGKTRWVLRLAPPEMGVILEGAAIDPNNKDSVINAVSHWIAELGELDATFRKADIARLKSFVTQAVDKLRRPYDRIESEYQRRTVFFASVNEDRYLVDDTGNRRWWTIPVISVDYQHDLDVQQIWAELLAHYQRGEQWWLTKAELAALNALNAEHEAVDPVEELILKTFDWSRDSYGDEMTASEVLIAIGFDRPSRAQATHASDVLKKLTGGKPRRSGAGRFFRMPPRVSRSDPAF